MSNLFIYFLKTFASSPLEYLILRNKNTKKKPNEENEVDALSKRYETRRVSGANTRSAVLYRLVGQTELAQVVADHLGLDLHLVEGLAVVHAHHAADHLGYNDGVAQMRLDHGGLLERRRLLLGLAQALQQRRRLALQASAVAAASAACQQLHELLTCKRGNRIKLNFKITRYKFSSLKVSQLKCSFYVLDVSRSKNKKRIK